MTARALERAEVYIRPMQLADIPAVLDIERRSFPTPWSENAFRTELTRNDMAHYIVVCSGAAIIGYAGMWLVLNEAHITNIAIAPSYRGRGVGSRLLMALMERARRAGINEMTLEVRVSNQAAQILYGRYGFLPKGLRRGYYTDTNEDAIVMWCRDIGEALRKKRAETRREDEVAPPS